MTLSRWIRRKIFGADSAHPAQARVLKELADEVSSEARELRRRMREPDALESLVHRASDEAQRRIAKGYKNGRKH